MGLAKQFLPARERIKASSRQTCEPVHTMDAVLTPDCDHCAKGSDFHTVLPAEVVTQYLYRSPLFSPEAKQYHMPPRFSIGVFDGSQPLKSPTSETL